MAKGNKRFTWLVQGVKASKKVNKKIWNKKVRRSKNLSDHCFYKKLAGVTMYDMVL